MKRSMPSENCTNRSVLPLPMKSIFDDLSERDAVLAHGLWASEPTLRTLTYLLDSLHPSHNKYLCCPFCGNSVTSFSANSAASRTGRCASCGGTFSASYGTPFYRLSAGAYRRLYGTLLTLWGPWKISCAWRIAGCSGHKQFADLRHRLEPLFDELMGNEPLVSIPAYRLGFTPAQQGIRCPRCAGEHLVFGKRRVWTNPFIHCLDCVYAFQLHTSCRKLLPLKPGIVCPECGSASVTRNSSSRDGRGKYRCGDCRRRFVEGSKRPDLPLKPRLGKGKLLAPDPLQETPRISQSLA